MATGNPGGSKRCGRPEGDRRTLVGGPSFPPPWPFWTTQYVAYEAQLRVSWCAHDVKSVCRLNYFGGGGVTETVGGHGGVYACGMTEEVLLAQAQPVGGFDADDPRLTRIDHLGFLDCQRDLQVGLLLETWFFEKKRRRFDVAVGVFRRLFPT